MSAQASTIDAIAMTEAKVAVLALPADASIEDKLRTAMRVTRDHWLLSQQRSDGRSLRAAVGGVCLALGAEHPDYERVAREHRALANLSNALDAAQRGVPVDFGALDLGNEEDGEPMKNPIGILAIWNEAPR